MSVDSVFVHKMWNDNELSKMVKGGVPFPMLSDGGGKVGVVARVFDFRRGLAVFVFPRHRTPHDVLMFVSGNCQIVRQMNHCRFPLSLVL